MLFTMRVATQNWQGIPMEEIPTELATRIGRLKSEIPDSK
jgi:hypothetical protein